MAESLGSGDTEDQQLSVLNDPIHERRLQDLRAQTMLHVLMADDPVIKSHNPYEVASAYGELSRLAPNMFQQPAAVTPYLRKRLQQGLLDTFEVGQLSSLENGSKSDRQGAAANAPR